MWRSPEDLVRWNAVACGVLFVLLGRYLSSTNRKAHFEPIAVHLGWLLILAALVSAAPLPGAEGILCTILLFTAGAALAWRALYTRRFVLFAFGLLGSYIAASIVAVEFIDTPLWLITSAAALIAWLWRVQRRKKEPL